MDESTPTSVPADPSGSAVPGGVQPSIVETPKELVDTPNQDSAAIVGSVIGAVATRVSDDLSEVATHVEEGAEKLASEIETEAQSVLESAYRKVDELHASANKHPDSIAAHTVGLLHSDTVTIPAEKIGNEGPRQEQIHTSLTPG
jgi:DNA anti-recombination protein RmuC